MSRPHFLVVDDRRNMLHMLEKLLRHDAIVHTASSGAEAVTALQAHAVAVVICDLRLPDMNGIDVLRACKRLCHAPEFVLMTAYATVPTAVEAMREGAFDYVIKPFEPEALRSIVLRALQRTSGRLSAAAEERYARSSSEGEVNSGAVEDLSTQTGAAASFEVMSGLVDMKWQQAIDLGRRETARQYLQAVIRRHHGRVADAAVHAGVERESFYRLLRKFNVQPDGTSDPDDEDT